MRRRVPVATDQDAGFPNYSCAAMDEPDPALIIRPTSLATLAATFFLMGSVAWGLVILPVLLLLHPPPSLADTIVILVLDELTAVAGAWFAWRSTRLGIVADHEGLLVRNWFGDHRIAIVDIAGFEVGSGYVGIAVRLRDGTGVTMNAVQKTNMARWLGRRVRADDVVAELNGWLDYQRPGKLTEFD